MFQKQVLRFLWPVRGCASLPAPRRPCSSRPTNQGRPPENESLLESLSLLGVDLSSARRRQPGVLRRLLTNERGLALFLKSKGAEPEAVASIISRFPRSITRSCQHLEERWTLWRNVFRSDAEVLGVLSRSPESFFRSSDNENLQENISFLRTLGMTGRDLHRLLTTAPRTFSNSVELNRSMVEFLKSMCVRFGGADPQSFALAVISRNLYIFIRSTGRIRANVDFLCSSLGLSDAEALGLFHGHGAQILDVSHESLKKNVQRLREKLGSLGCSEDHLRRMILNYSPVLFVSSERLSDKMDCLLDGGVPLEKILRKPKILDFSLDCLRERLLHLNALGYDFQRNGVAVLDTSKKRFFSKLQRLSPDTYG
ncbi:transcription termination factor 1a, mitochondrial [Puntigrus tetrazona]|uniref:transcription termination factor 1a, mitochondrial n=1 Tax=Puntigrus tetrazona TaxID=1606681 RepID=UPI001C8A7A52|nr:transcription termination factor 1a, mitochondrial [Puntigrus tetrazona]XP_043088967.1 transcription termination factor 1a, mitochondrial [Puntigrus tetrazona]